MSHGQHAGQPKYDIQAQRQYGIQANHNQHAVHVLVYVKEIKGRQRHDQRQMDGLVIFPVKLLQIAEYIFHGIHSTPSPSLSYQKPRWGG